jgi:hypothetical protein
MATGESIRLKFNKPLEESLETFTNAGCSRVRHKKARKRIEKGKGQANGLLFCRGQNTNFVFFSFHESGPNNVI